MKMAQHSNMRRISVSFLLVLLLHPLHGLNIPHEARSQDHPEANVTLSTANGNVTAENLNNAHPSATNVTVSKANETPTGGAPNAHASADPLPKGSKEPVSANASLAHSPISTTGANSTSKADHGKEGEVKEGDKSKDGEAKESDKSKEGDTSEGEAKEGDKSKGGMEGAKQKEGEKAKEGEHEPEIETGLFTFASKRSRDFYVSGRKIPLVKWNVGPSYSGLLPTKEAAKKGDRELFFWFFPATCTTGKQHLTVWLSGGAGCSSLTGVLEGNGPISWLPGQPSPSKNPYAWTNSTSMLYVEQPVGVGYAPAGLSSGESQIASDFFGFMQNFLQVFPEMAPMKLYLAGESYAGMFIPYIADYIYQHQAKLATKLQGTLLIDPLITHPAIQTQIPVYQYVERHQDILRLNGTTLATLKTRYESCGYKQYYDLHMAIPPKHDGPFQAPPSSLYDMDGHKNLTCDLWSLVNASVQETNPAFNVYHISEANPAPWSALGLSPNQGAWVRDKEDPVYFNRTDVKKALHAPASVGWKVCKDPREIFPHGDDSDYTSLSVLPHVIERSKKTIIVHGGLDFNLLSEGTRLAIQNMTWGGKQGFRFPINESLQIAGSGTVGTYHTERNLTFIELDGAGQSVSMYEPRGSLQILEFLLDMRANLSGPNMNSTAEIFPHVGHTTTTHSTGIETGDKKSPARPNTAATGNKTSEVHPTGTEAPDNTTDAHPAAQASANKTTDAHPTGKEMPSNTTDAHPAAKETPATPAEHPAGKEMPANTTDAHPATKETPATPAEHPSGKEMPANTTNARPTEEEPANKPSKAHTPANALNGTTNVSPEHDKDQHPDV